MPDPHQRLQTFLKLTRRARGTNLSTLERQRMFKICTDRFLEGLEGLLRMPDPQQRHPHQVHLF